MKKCFHLFVFLLFFGLLSANSLDEIRKSGVVRVGVFENQPPFSKLEDGHFDGFEVNLAHKISEKIFSGLKGEVKLIPIKADERISVLQNNKVDFVIATLTITNERKQLIDFSTPYFSVNIGVLTPQNQSVKTLEDLKGEKILIENGTTAEGFFKEKGFEIIGCKTAGECYRRLKDGEGAGYASDNLVVLAFPVIDSDLEVNIKNLGKADFLGIGIAKNNKELKSVIDSALVELSKEKFFKNSFENYLNVYYKGTAESKYFLLDDIYAFFG